MDRKPIEGVGRSGFEVLSVIDKLSIPPSAFLVCYLETPARSGRMQTECLTQRAMQFELQLWWILSSISFRNTGQSSATREG